MAIRIQTLSFKTTSSDRDYEPVLRKGARLRPLLLQLSPGSSRGLGKNTATVRHVSPLSCLYGRRFVQWRKFQFRDPDDTYVYRARIEPQPPQLPVPPAEPKQHNAAVSIKARRPTPLYISSERYFA